MGRSLYEINEELLSLIDDETGEITDINLFDQISLERDQKIEGVGLWIKNLKSDAKAYREEANDFLERARRNEKKIESLEGYLTFYLEGEKFHSQKLDIGWRRSDALVVDDESEIPMEYWKPQELKLDKAGLKKAIKEGLECDGVRVVERKNIQIK